MTQLPSVSSSFCVSIPFRADTGFELPPSGDYKGSWLRKFQSLSGLTLGLNTKVSALCLPFRRYVSIPFRADTGFERRPALRVGEHVKFQSLSGLTLGLNSGLKITRDASQVSIPFRADTGFEPSCNWNFNGAWVLFQSLSGLTLGLNLVSLGRFTPLPDIVSIPFRADTGFEHC